MYYIYVTLDFPEFVKQSVVALNVLRSFSFKQLQCPVVSRWIHAISIAYCTG